MFKTKQIINVHWDGPAKATVVAIDGDQVTIRKGTFPASGEEITLQQDDLAGLVR